MPGALAVLDLDYTINGNALTLFAGVVDVTGKDSGVNGIWQSNDGGISWSQMFIAPLADIKTGQPVSESSIGLINLAADHTPGIPYGVFAAITNGPARSLMNVFRLDGNIWKPTGQGLRAINTTSAQSIGIAPNGHVYVGGVNDARQRGLYQSVDGGAHWVSIDVGSNGLRPHTDQHAWAFYGNGVYNGNDGGIWRFMPLLNGQPGPGTWESLNTSTLQTILAQGVGLHPRDANILLEGSQDNGIALRSSTGNWKWVQGGDSSRVRFDPNPKNNGQYAYTTGVSDYKFFFRSDDGGSTWNNKSVPGKPNVPWYAPFVFHPADSSRILVGLDRVYETRKRGDQWTAISGTLAGNNQFISAMIYTGSDTIYVAYGVRLFKTTNDGGNGSDINWPEIGIGVNFGGGITALAADSRFTEVLYAATDGGSVWRTKNGGATWEDISGNLPQVGISSIVLKSDTGAADPFLFVGTSLGVYGSTDQENITGWRRLGSGLPITRVTDLQYNSTTNVLAAAIYGRGVFTIFANFENPTVHIQIPKDECGIGPVEGSKATLHVKVVAHMRRIARSRL